MTPEQKRKNRNMALTLLSVVIVLFVGFMVKSALLAGL